MANGKWAANAHGPLAEPVTHQNGFRGNGVYAHDGKRRKRVAGQPRAETNEQEALKGMRVKLTRLSGSDAENRISEQLPYLWRRNTKNWSFVICEWLLVIFLYQGRS